MLGLYQHRLTIKLNILNISKYLVLHIHMMQCDINYLIFDILF